MGAGAESEGVETSRNEFGRIHKEPEEVGGSRREMMGVGRCSEGVGGVGGHHVYRGTSPDLRPRQRTPHFLVMSELRRPA
jgi:hypothetical protein